VRLIPSLEGLVPDEAEGFVLSLAKDWSRATSRENPLGDANEFTKGLFVRAFLF
jgi:hypothetical protein